MIRGTIAKDLVVLRTSDQCVPVPVLPAILTSSHETPKEEESAAYHPQPSTQTITRHRHALDLSQFMISGPVTLILAVSMGCS